jgi:hypothetical protein
MKASKLIRAVSAAAVALAFASGASAQSTVSVAVKVSLTGKCEWKTTSPTGVTLDFGTYTAFGSAATASASPFTVHCTRGFAAPTASWDATGGTVAGLAYTVAGNSGTKTGGTAASGGAGATADDYTFTLTGNMVAGQAGDSGVAATDTRTLTMSF